MKYEVIEIELYEGKFITQIVEATTAVEAMVLYFGENDSDVACYIKDEMVEVRSGEWKIHEEEKLFIIREVK